MSHSFTFKQVVVPSYSVSKPYSISVASAAFTKQLYPKSNTLLELFNQIKSDLLYISYRHADFMEAKKLPIDPVFALYGEYKAKEILPINYHAYLIDKGIVDVTTSAFNALRQEYSNTFAIAADEIINSFYDILLKIEKDSKTTRIVQDISTELIDKDKQAFVFESKLNHHIRDKVNLLKFSITKPLASHVTMLDIHNLYLLPEKQRVHPFNHKHETDKNSIKSNTAILSYDISPLGKTL